MGGLVEEVGTLLLTGDGKALDEAADTLSPWTALVANAAVSAGVAAPASRWACAAVELAIAAADLSDDLSDGDAPPEMAPYPPGALEAVSLGLLALASGAALRVTEDGAAPGVACDVAAILAHNSACAAEGQARNLAPADGDALAAFHEARAKSGPIGGMAARMGARLGTDDPGLLDLYERFGRHVTTVGQLRNDTRDASPDGNLLKADVRAARRTVPLAFAGIVQSAGSAAPVGWERAARQQVAERGGLRAAVALATLERRRALETLLEVQRLGRPIAGLRQGIGRHEDDPDVLAASVAVDACPTEAAAPMA